MSVNEIQRTGLDVLTAAALTEGIQSSRDAGAVIGPRVQVVAAPLMGGWDTIQFSAKALLGTTAVPFRATGRLFGLVADESGLSADIYLQICRVFRALESLAFTAGSTLCLLPSLAFPQLVVKVGDLTGVNSRWEHYGAASTKEKMQEWVQKGQDTLKQYARDPKVQRYASYTGLGLATVLGAYWASGFIGGSSVASDALVNYEGATPPETPFEEGTVFYGPALPPQGYEWPAKVVENVSTSQPKTVSTPVYEWSDSLKFSGGTAPAQPLLHGKTQFPSFSSVENHKPLEPVSEGLLLNGTQSDFSEFVSAEPAASYFSMRNVIFGAGGLVVSGILAVSCVLCGKNETIKQRDLFKVLNQ